MRRADLRDYVAWFLTLAFVVACVAPAALGDPGDIYDDRPPLLASEPAPAGQAAATRLTDVTVAEPGADGTFEIWLDADGAVPYQVFTLTGPDRIVFDLPGLVAANAGRRVEASDTGLVRVRVGQYREAPDAMARVVLDLTQPMQWAASREGDHLIIQLAPSGVSLPSVSAPSEVGASGQAPVASADSELLAATEPTDAVEQVPAAVEPSAVEAELPLAGGEELPAGVADENAASTEAVETAPVEPQAEAAQTAWPERPAPTAASLETDAAPSVAAPEATPTPANLETGPAPPLEGAFATRTPPKAPETAQPAELERGVQDGSSLEPDIARVVEQAAGLAQKAEPQEQRAVSLPVETSGTNVVPLPDTEAKTIEDARRVYVGKKVTLQLVDADIKQVFTMFHEISGLNFVLDPAVSGVVTIVVDDVPWDQALDLILKNNGLDMVLEGNVIRIAPISKLAQESAARKALFEAKELEVPPVTITRTLSYAKAKEIQAVVRDGILSPKGRVIVDKRTNTLIIRDIPTRVEAIDRLLTTLDAETPQVMIEARIVEVSRDFVKDLGIRWGIFASADPVRGTQTGLQFPHRATGSFDMNLERNPAASALGLSFGNVLDSVTLDITLDALETEGYARRLSSPKIATQNNERAEIEQGVRIPVVSTTATEIDVRFVSASLRLQCTPQITAEGTVVLEIEVENNSPDFVNTVGEVPAINTQRATTKVLIADGGTTVIGGIFTVNEGQSESGIPWFRKIPGLGWLFRSKNIQTRNRELLIFITPRIIKAS